MLKRITSFIVLLLFISVGFSLAGNPHREVKLTPPTSGVNDIKPSNPNFTMREIDNHFPPMSTSGTTITYHPTGLFTVYDLQSNGVPNEIWQDPLIPTNVHATFMYSTVAGFATRDCAYLFSNDFGASWTNLGDVPSGFRSGFPSISGTSTGAAIIANHNNSNGTGTHTKLYVDLGPGIGAFTEYDPGNTSDGEPIWPRVVGKSNGAVFASSINGAEFQYTNTLTTPAGTFSGYTFYSGDQAETYWVARASNGNIGHAYIGSGVTDPNDAFFRESTDGGVTWGTPTRIWDWNINTDSIGVLRGISMTYLGNAPFVAFNTSLLTETGFFPGLPSQIRVWSPGINGGVPVVIADSSNVPFFPNQGSVSDAFLPICRPAIGHSSDNTALFVAFNSTSGVYGTDTSSYYDARLRWSVDGGQSWPSGNMSLLNPTTPRRDWRFISISQSNNVTPGPPPECLVQMMCQSDSLAGTHVNGSPIGSGEAVGIRALVPLITGISTISSTIPAKYNLYQNFPNPFNPSTSIRFDITKSTNVTLKVYDVNGREIATLVNNEVVSPGTKEVRFEASNFSTGIYFYTLYAGDFKETKKMMLIK